MCSVGPASLPPGAAMKDMSYDTRAPSQHAKAPEHKIRNSSRVRSDAYPDNHRSNLCNTSWQVYKRQQVKGLFVSTRSGCTEHEIFEALATRESIDESIFSFFLFSFCYFHYHCCHAYHYYDQFTCTHISLLLLSLPGALHTPKLSLGFYLGDHMSPRIGLTYTLC